MKFTQERHPPIAAAGTKQDLTIETGMLLERTITRRSMDYDSI